MTKKTNAIALRLGYNLFWLYKKSNTLLFYSFYSLFHFFQIELKKNHLLCFKLKPNLRQINLSVYAVYPKNFDISQFSKFLNKISSLRKIYIHTNKYMGRFKIRKGKFLLYNYFWLFYYFYIENLLNFNLMIRGFLSNFSVICLSNLLKYIIDYSIKYSSISNKINSNISWLISRNQVKSFVKPIMINFKHPFRKIIFFKILELSLEQKLIKYYKLASNIVLNNVINDSIIGQILIKYRLDIIKFFVRHRNKRSNLLLYFIFNLDNIELLVRYLGSLLYENHKHKVKIRFFIKSIYFLILNRLINLKGLKLYISGKLNKKMKSSKYAYKFGEIWLNTLDTSIRYYYLPLYTKFGVFSIKIWLST